MSWNHDELAEDLGDIKGTNFLNVPLGSVYLDFYARSYNGEPLEGNNIQRADVINVKPSYNRFCLTIYEIKISRSDFQSDIRSGKWRGYLNHCHRFYFAVPSGIVKKEEVPEEAGLIVRGETGWITLKAALSRDIEIPYMTLLSLIFSKEREHFRGHKRNRIYDSYQKYNVMAYMKKQEFYKTLGKNIGEALRNFDEYKTAKSELEYQIKHVNELISEGLGEQHRWPEWELEKLVERIKKRAMEDTSNGQIESIKN
jgi:hypothetical protein